MTTRNLITAPQIRGDNFFGGLPYGVSWDFKDGSTPSTLKVQLVNELGQYTVTSNDLSYLKSSTVTIGNLVFRGYLTDFSIEKTPEQKILTLEYTDLSADLERWYVGLYNRYGYATNKDARLIIVGKIYHPCDQALSSTAGANNHSSLDVCDPCPFMPYDKYANSCGGTATSPAALIDFQIFEVWYTFDDLYNEISKYFSVSGGDKITKNSNNYPFRAQHTGSLKRVLDAWCADLGLVYYWDPFVNKLFFIDRSKPINIPPANIVGADPLIVDFTYGASKKNTFSRGFLGYFSKDGSIHDYNCTIDPTQSFIDTAPVTFEDLIGVDDDGDYSVGTYSYLQKLQIQTALAYYSRALRDSFLWFGYYEIITKDGAKSAIGQSLIEFGNMEILDVYSQDDSSPEKFKNINENLPSQKKQDLAGFSYYYIVASYDDDLASSQFTNVEDRANNLLGKYWYSRFNTPIPGGTNANTNVNVNTADGGSGNWYISGTDLSTLPIFKFGFAADSNIGNLVTASNTDDENNSTLIDSGVSGGGNYVTGEQDKVVTSFVLATREPQWWPSKDKIQDYNSLFKWYDDLLPELFDDGRPEVLFNIYPEALKDPTIKLFIAKEYPALRSSDKYQIIIQQGSNDNEPTSQSPKNKIEQDVLGNPVKLFEGMWGLRSNKTWILSLPGMSITLPVGAWKSNGASQNSSSDFVSGQTSSLGKTSIIDPAAPAYTIALNVSESFKKVLPKVEHVYQQLVSSIDVAKIDYHFKDIRENNLSLVQGINRSCIPTGGDIDNYLKQISQNSFYSMPTAQQRISYKIAGVNPTTSYSISQGLSSIQISLTNNGFYTSYTLEDKIIRAPSDDYVLQSLIARTIDRGTLSSSQQNGPTAKMIGNSYNNSQGSFNNTPNPGQIKQ